MTEARRSSVSRCGLLSGDAVGAWFLVSANCFLVWLGLFTYHLLDHYDLPLVSTIFVTTPSGATSGGSVISGTIAWTRSTNASLMRLVMSVDLPVSSSPAMQIRTSRGIVTAWSPYSFFPPAGTRSERTPQMKMENPGMPLRRPKTPIESKEALRSLRGVESPP